MKKCENIDDDDFVFGPKASDFASVMATLFSIAGVCLNLLVIISLINYRRTRRHVTTPFIISLSVLDLVYAGLILPVYAARFGNRETPLSEGLCKFFPVAFYGTMGASLLSLTMVTVNRACMLYFPNKVDRIFTNNKEIGGHNIPVNSLIILLICWLIPLFLLLPSYFQGLTGLNKNTASCTILASPGRFNQKNMFYIIGFFVPSIGLILSDIAIYVKLKQIQRKDCRNSLATVDEKKMEKMFMLMLAAMYVIFILTYLPSLLIKIFDKCYNHETIHIMAYVINWASVVINPILYVVSQKKYKDAIINLKDTLTLALPSCSRNGKKQRSTRIANIQQFGESSSSQTEKEDKADKGGEEFKMRSVTVSPLNTRYLDSVIFNSPTGSPKTSSWLSSGVGSMSEATAPS